MEPFLLYSIKSGICLALFYVCFKALLSNDTFFRFNRWVLLAGIGICLLLPLSRIRIIEASPMQLPVRHIERIIGNYSPVVSDTLPISMQAASPVQPQPEANIPWGQLIVLFYFGGCALCLVTTALSFHKMYRIIHAGRKIKQGDFTLVLTAGPISPFSWGSYIILSEDDFRTNPQEILTHEKMHLHYRHSLDLIYMEMIILLHWYNPTVWLLKRELRDIHEYQADKGVLNQGIDATKYQLLLVKKTVGSSLYTLANSFNHSKIKKRITMMLKKKSNNWGRLKLLLLIPVGLTALSVFARPEINPPTETVMNNNVQVPPPTSTDQPNKDPLPTTDKSTTIQKDIKEDYNVYLSFTKNNDAGKEVLGGITIYGVSEQKALEIAEKAIKNGSFKAATKVVICPQTPKVPKSYMEKMKGLFDANNIKCSIAQAQGYDKDGNLLPPPPPPPPAPDVY